jgi:TonB family protein
MSIDNFGIWGETPLQTLILTSCASSVMAYYVTSGRDFSQSGFWAGEASMQPDGPTTTPLGKTDLTELAAKFAATTGPGLAPDLALDLALQMVLHEIVEEACLATAATGAAIAVSHDGELVCRASHGLTAPPLGTRLDSGVGLSGECLRTKQIQLCNDTQTDMRVDFEACSRLGVHSLVVVPLLRASEIVGIFEVLSLRPSAFGERDVGMLKALAERVLKNLHRAADPSVALSNTESSESSDLLVDPQLVEAEAATAFRRWTDIVTWALAGVVLACAGWLTMRVVRHFTVQTEAVHRPATEIKVAARGLNQPVAASARGDAATGQRSDLPPPATSTMRDRAEESRSDRRARPAAAEGGLRMYENGREVFRMPPSSGGEETPTETGVVQAASVQAENVLELSASAAESGLIHRVEPEYPEAARLQGIQGSVVLEVQIHPDGTVEELKIVSGQPLLADAAIAAVKQWRFRPRQMNGQPATMQTTVTLNFRLPS